MFLHRLQLSDILQLWTLVGGWYYICNLWHLHRMLYMQLWIMFYSAVHQSNVFIQFWCYTNRMFVFSLTMSAMYGGRGVHIYVFWNLVFAKYFRNNFEYFIVYFNLDLLEESWSEYVMFYNFHLVITLFMFQIRKWKLSKYGFERS